MQEIHLLSLNWNYYIPKDEKKHIKAYSKCVVFVYSDVCGTNICCCFVATYVCMYVLLRLFVKFLKENIS